MPAAAVPALSASVELEPVVTEAGVKPAVAPLGTPDIERLMVSALPDNRAVEMVLLPPVPAARLKVVGLAEMEKSLVATPQPGNLNEAIRVTQLNDPFAGISSVVYQNVQSSAGSTAIML